MSPITTTTPPATNGLHETSPPDAEEPSGPNYAHQIAYWSEVESTVNGMLGGFPQVSRIDLQSSSNFLAKISRQMPVPEDGVKKGVDCGAGIGRVTKGLLSKHLDVVDIVEPIKKFTDEILTSDEFSSLVSSGKIGDIYNVGLESWEPEEGKYWCIWNQWCLPHLTTPDLTTYLHRCSKALTPGGLIFVKENIAREEDEFDPEDSSVTRTDESYRKIFADAGLLIIKSELQRGFPESLGLFPVRMYALKPVGGGGGKKWGCG
ncbi:hypothetical protein ABW19_dt0201305 [Dactylella cylindrospora]|nr:hypothetical protein ABW19_dt0201305 [Dactylella cylindrospora]